MYYFSFETKNDVVETLKHVPIHDSVYRKNQYDKEKKEWEIELYNAICNVNICITFQGVCLVLTTDFDIWGTNNTISSLTLENDYTFLTPFLENADEINKRECLYFLFQSFSGNEMHIVCKTALCAIINQGQNQSENTGDGSLC